MRAANSGSSGVESAQAEPDRGKPLLLEEKSAHRRLRGRSPSDMMRLQIQGVSCLSPFHPSARGSAPSRDSSRFIAQIARRPSGIGSMGPSPPHLPSPNPNPNTIPAPSTSIRGGIRTGQARTETSPRLNASCRVTPIEDRSRVDRDSTAPGLRGADAFRAHGRGGDRHRGSSHDAAIGTAAIE